MRLPTISLDFWQLVSGEERQQAAPSTFEIPTLTERSNLTSGQGAKLIFEIEAKEEDGTVSTSTERMWVIVSRKAGNYYFGILDSEPVTVPNDGQFYLLRGAEIPFQAEHVFVSALLRKSMQRAFYPHHRSSAGHRVKPTPSLMPNVRRHQNRVMNRPLISQPSDLWLVNGALFAALLPHRTSTTNGRFGRK